MAVQNETRTFFQGKQNRDNDPRTIPNGEFIRMVNGRINRSEGSTVGALENSQGNEAVSSFVDAEGVVVGSIRDNGNNVLYYFIKGSEEDAVYEYSEETGIARPMLRDNVGILNFNVDFLITGINIIGDGDDRLLLWTDGFNPPRKVNIERAFRTLQGDVNGFTEQEISVEKNPPLFPPIATAVIVENIEDADEREELDKEENLQDKFVRFAYRWRYIDGEYSVFSPFSQAGFIPGRFEFDLDTGAVTGMENQIKALDVSFDTGQREVTEIDLLYKEDGSTTVYVVETFVKADREWNNNVILGEIVENIFTGQQTNFNLPDRLRDTDPILDVTRGTLGNMTLTTDFTFTRGELGNPDVLILGTALVENESVVVRYYNNAESIRFSSNKLYRALPADQLSRVFDNVPIRAKTQDIIQNRIVYGNYVDRYDLEDVLKTYEEIDGRRVLTGTRTEEIVVDMTARLSEPITEDNLITGDLGERSLKSDRNYEVGIVYMDNLGRQTPVLTSENNTVSVPIDRANKINRLSVDINSKAPEWARAYRFFVKQNRGQHFNIIPLETQLQPDDNRFIWFRLSTGDQEKISEGDYLNLKVTNATYTYLTNDMKLQVRVEEVGPQERNFLEVSPPRSGRLTLEDGSERAGEVLDPGIEITVQEAGIWMKVKNESALGVDFETVNAVQGESIARSNNARGTMFQPIQGDIEDYQDITFYYRGSNIGSGVDADESAVTFGGTYLSGEDRSRDTAENPNPAEGQAGHRIHTDGLITGPGGDDIQGAGPMRVQVEITEGQTFRYSWWLSPDFEQPAVIRQTMLADVPIRRVDEDGDPVPGVEGLTHNLVNGTTVVFNMPPEDFSAGDRFVVTYRLAENFMWRAFESDISRAGSGRNLSPNSTGRRSYGARRSKSMFTGAGLFDEGINGRSRFQLGVVDGLGRRNEGDPIAFPFRRNEFTTSDTFYDTFEEMMFEEGFWTSGTDPNFMGTDREGGGFGIHQMGFWRGLPLTAGNRTTLDELIIGYFAFIVGSPIALLIHFFSGDLTTENAWRLMTGSGARIMNPMGADVPEDATPLPLHGFIESGVLNSSRNNRKNDIRMNTNCTFTQGTGADANDLQSLNLVLETVPEEIASDIYFEHGQTFPCLNGIHFGNEMSNAQRVMQEIGINESGNETQEVTPIAVDLDYFNCFAWNNGVESCVIRDEFTGNRLDPGAKSSQVVNEYEQRENFSNLIFSSAFNQSTNTNGLNEFSSFATATGAIIKEMDEQDGSIQHLFSRDTDLVVFQEDKITKVLSDKSALFNADGTTNLTSGQPILGQIVPYTGEFGISQDPESFSVYGGRLYFTDRSRGAVLRLSQDGLTEISNLGMRDFFREELAEDYDTTRKALAIGSYDDFHDQYVLSLRAPLPDPSVDSNNLPLQISRQAFLSRTDACRFPEEDIQNIEVYEFYTADEPAGFQVGDIIYTDVDRQFIFLGDNDWFIWFDSEADIDLTSNAATTDAQGVITQSFTYVDDHVNSPSIGQSVVVSARDDNPMDYNATVVSYSRLQNGANSTIVVRYDAGTVLEDGDELAGVPFEIAINYKFVINIDNFGFVRAKLDCVGITPPNHDAVRVSISSYQTPQEACGKGLVARIVYHNGDDATPDVGDSIYDTPYASDEFVAGCYMKGRTQKQGWYQMFDGFDLQDYVIRILQGKVVEKIRCDVVMAGRRRLLTSETPTQRGVTVTRDVNDNIISEVPETQDRLATRVCAMLPSMERWYNGTGNIPELGDTLFEDNFTLETAPAGFYAIEDGFYVQVTELGIISFIGRCSITICVDDVIEARLLAIQNQEANVWEFLGVNALTGDLPTVAATPANYTLTEGVQSLAFNGTITSLGDFRTGTYSWYYQIGGPEPTERELVADGFEVTGGTYERTGSVDEVSVTFEPEFTTIWHVFVADVEDVRVTTPVLSTRTLRLTNPNAATVALTNGNLRTLRGTTALLTATPDPAINPLDTFTSQWCVDGVDIPGQTGLTLSLVLGTINPFGVYTYKQRFEGLDLESAGTTFTEIFAPAPSIFAVFSADQTSVDLTSTGNDPDHPDENDLTFAWFNVTDSANPVDLNTPSENLTISEVGTYESRVSDPDGNEGRDCFVVSAGGAGLNNGPVAIITAAPLGEPGGQFTFTLSSSDDQSTVLTQTLTQDGVNITPAGIGTDALNNFSVTVTLPFALPTTFEFTVTDDLGATTTASHTVNPSVLFINRFQQFSGAYNSNNNNRTVTYDVEGNIGATFQYSTTASNGPLNGSNLTGTGILADEGGGLGRANFAVTVAPQAVNEPARDISVIIARTGITQISPGVSVVVTLPQVAGIQQLRVTRMRLYNNQANADAGTAIGEIGSLLNTADNFFVRVEGEEGATFSLAYDGAAFSGATAPVTIPAEGFITRPVTLAANPQGSAERTASITVNPTGITIVDAGVSPLTRQQPAGPALPALNLATLGALTGTIDADVFNAAAAGTVFDVGTARFNYTISNFNGNAVSIAVGTQGAVNFNNGGGNDLFSAGQSTTLRVTVTGTAASGTVDVPIRYSKATGAGNLSDGNVGTGVGILRTDTGRLITGNITITAFEPPEQLPAGYDISVTAAPATTSVVGSTHTFSANVGTVPSGWTVQSYLWQGANNSWDPDIGDLVNTNPTITLNTQADANTGQLRTAGYRAGCTVTFRHTATGDTDARAGSFTVTTL